MEIATSAAPQRGESPDRTVARGATAPQRADDASRLGAGVGAGVADGDANGERARDGDRPLWLPHGSVRALMALGVMGVWAALEVGALGAEPSDAVRSMAIAVTAGYGFLRVRASDRRQDRSDR